MKITTVVSTSLLLMAITACNKQTPPETPAKSEKPAAVTVGGEPVVALEVTKPTDPNVFAFTSAQVLPGRGMNTFQIRAQVPGKGEVNVLDTPYSRRSSASNGWRAGRHHRQQILHGRRRATCPIANRITGKLSADGKTIETTILGKTVAFPANWGGKKPGARNYAMSISCSMRKCRTWGVRQRASLPFPQRFTPVTSVGTGRRKPISTPKSRSVTTRSNFR